MAELKLYSKSRVKPESTYLQKYRKNIKSQDGEDGVIEKILEILGVSNKWCVEFGAWNGQHFSNSWALINNNSWNAVLIEGKEDRFQELNALYANNKNVTTINLFIEIDTSKNSLDSVLGSTDIPVDFDFLCIDIDGCDWHIWDSLNNYKPRLVVIEFNPTIPNHVSFVQDRNMSVNHGSSLRAMIELGKRKGYEIVATTGWNAFFVIAADYSMFNINDNSIDSMFTLENAFTGGNAESTFFQLYDGTVVLCGCKHLIWKDGIEITNEDIQILPRALRQYQK